MSSNNVIIPLNQNVTIQPFSNRIFDYNNYESRHYLSRAINLLLKALGEDCVLSGFRVKRINYDNQTHHLEVTLHPGMMIVDSTLIEYPSDSVFELNLAGYSDVGGRLIISAGFEYLHNPNRLYSRMKLSYVTADGSLQAPEAWCDGYDRLVIAELVFDKTHTKDVTDITPKFNNSKKIVINNKEYYVYARDSITRNFQEYFESIYVSPY